MDPRTDIVVVAALLVAARTVVADPSRWCAYPHALDANGHSCEGRANDAVCWGAAGALDRAAADAGAPRARHRRGAQATEPCRSPRRERLDGRGLDSGPQGRPRHDRRQLRRGDRRHAQAGGARRSRHPQPLPHTHRPSRPLGAGRHRTRPERAGAHHLRRRLPLLRRAGAVGLAAHVLGHNEAARRSIHPAVDQAGRLLDCAAYTRPTRSRPSARWRSPAPPWPISPPASASPSASSSSAFASATLRRSCWTPTGRTPSTWNPSRRSP